MASDTKQKTDERLAEIIATLYPHYRLWFDDSRDTFTVKMTLEYRNWPTGILYKAKREFADVQLVQLDEPEEVLAHILMFMQEFTYSLGEDITGKYPFARLWLDRHLNQDDPLFGNPANEIPKWMWPRVKGNQEYPHDGWVPTGKKIKIDVVTDNETAPKPVVYRLVRNDLPQVVQGEPEHYKPFVARPKNPPAFVDYGVKEVDLVTDKKRKQIVSAPKLQFDPDKVRKPKCKLHSIPMPYNMITARFECPRPDCDISAAPRRGDGSKDVVLGKGGVQLRLICQEGIFSVILISDDNVALDVTGFVDVDKIMDDYDVAEQSKVAWENGKKSFAINVVHEVEFGMPLTVMGADEIAETKTVCGIDPSSKKIVVVERQKYVQKPIIHTCYLDAERIEDRQLQAFDFIVEIAMNIRERDGQSPQFYLEEPVVGQTLNYGATIVQAFVSGSIMAAAAQTFSRITLVNNSSWKAAIRNNGNIKKMDIYDNLVESEFWPEFIDAIPMVAESDTRVAKEWRGRPDQDVVDAGCICEFGWSRVMIFESLKKRKKKSSG